MILDFIATQDDFLTYHLYTDTTSALITKHKKRIRYGVSIFYFISGILMTLFRSPTPLYIGPIFIVVGVLWFLLYPQLFRYKRKRFYIKYIQEKYTNRVNQSVTMSMATEAIYTKVSGIESTVNRSELTGYTELPAYFLIGLTTGSFFIVPKRAITETTVFKDQMESYAIPYINALHWKW